MIKLFKGNNSGFTLAEVLIAGGIASLVALVAYTTLQSSQKTVNVSQAGAEIANLKSEVISNLGQVDICSANFVGQPVTRANIPMLYKRKKVSNATDFNLSYQDPANAFLTVGANYGKDRFKSLLITKIQSYPSIAQKTPLVINPNSMTVQVDYDILKTSSNTAVTPNQKGSFTVEIFIGKVGLNVGSCFSDIAGMVRAAVKGACWFDANETGKPGAVAPATTDNGVVYNPFEGTYGTCTHSSYELKNSTNTVVPPLPSPAPLGNMVTCPAGEYLAEVAVTEGTVNGSNQTVPGFRTYTCRKFSTTTGCPANSYMRGILSSGAADCITIQDHWNAFPGVTMTDGQPMSTVTPYAIKTTDINCGVDKVLQKIDSATGVKTCVAKILTTNCGVGQIVSAVDGNGTPTCTNPVNSGAGCPANTYLKAVNADGSIPVGGCVDLVINANCPGANDVMTGIDANGNAVCASAI